MPELAASSTAAAVPGTARATADAAYVVLDLCDTVWDTTDAIYSIAGYRGAGMPYSAPAQHTQAQVNQQQWALYINELRAPQN
jgi:hypothetical protein